MFDCTSSCRYIHMCMCVRVRACVIYMSPCLPISPFCISVHVHLRGSLALRVPLIARLSRRCVHVHVATCIKSITLTIPCTTLTRIHVTPDRGHSVQRTLTVAISGFNQRQIRVLKHCSRRLNLSRIPGCYPTTGANYTGRKL